MAFSRSGRNPAWHRRRKSGLFVVVRCRRQHKSELYRGKEFSSLSSNDRFYAARLEQSLDLRSYGRLVVVARGVRKCFSVDAVKTERTSHQGAWTFAIFKPYWQNA